MNWGADDKSKKWKVERRYTIDTKMVERETHESQHLRKVKNENHGNGIETTEDKKWRIQSLKVLVSKK